MECEYNSSIIMYTDNLMNFYNSPRFLKYCSVNTVV